MSFSWEPQDLVRLQMKNYNNKDLGLSLRFLIDTQGINLQDSSSKQIYVEIKCMNLENALIFSESGKEVWCKVFLKNL